MRANRPRQRGITVVEAAIAMAIAAIAASAVVPGLGSVVEKQRLEGVASQLASDLQQARAQAVLRNTGLRLSIHAAPWGSCYVVHSGAVGQCECEASGPAVCSGSAQPLKTVRLALADRIALQANVASLRFDPLHGTSTPAGTLRVVGGSGRAIHHVVNVMGRVRTCSPQGAAQVAGYPGC